MEKRQLRSAVLLAMTGVVILHGRSAAQRRFTPADVAQIADAVLGALVPPEQMLSRVSVAQRQVYFDAARTLEAFGYGASAESIQLPLRSTVKRGARSLLSDCRQAGGPCERLGWAAYVWIEPVSMAGPEIVVRAHAVWPDRGGRSFALGPQGRASLVGFSSDVSLARSGSRAWRFLRRVGPVSVY